MIDSQRVFVEPLLTWWTANGRNGLPWRESDRTPFQVIVAEILLQRTTAAAVAGVYNRHLDSRLGKPSWPETQ